MVLRTLDHLDVFGKRVLLRVDFNVTFERGHILDDYRVRAVIPTIRTLKQRGAKAIFLLSHLGRPRGRDNAFSLRNVALALTELFGEPVAFVEDCIGEKAQRVSRDANGGAVLLFENLRFHEGEKANDSVFAKALAELGDCFVNDAFGASHRAHASIVLLPKLLPSAAGTVVQREVKVLMQIRERPQHPFVVVLGGGKVADKLPMLSEFLPHAETVLLGGALANTVLAAQGVTVGASIYDAALARDMALLFKRYREKIIVPKDVVVSKARDGSSPSHICDAAGVRENELIVDIGPKTIEAFSEHITGAATVFWNGPLGIAEVAAFRSGTEGIVRAIAASSAFSVVGGGDTTRYPITMGLAEKISFLSTGGGAMLEFLAGREIPGIRALTE